MDTRSCAHCDTTFSPNNGKQRYCGDLCRHAAYRQRPKGAATVRRCKEDRYYNQTIPRGQRLQERLDNLFRAQAAVDPSGLPQLALRVLSWRPKGFMEIAVYARHPHGPLEHTWLYYADMSPEEAAVIYARED